MPNNKQRKRKGASQKLNQKRTQPQVLQNHKKGSEFYKPGNQTQGPGLFEKVAPMWNGISPPTNQLTRLRSVHSQGFSLTAVEVFPYVLSQNNVLTPDPTTSGPLMEYFNFWNKLYQTYRVVSSRLIVTITNKTPNLPIYCVVLPLIANSFPTNDTDRLNEQPFARNITIEPLGGRCTKVLDSGWTNPLETMARAYTTNHVTEGYQQTSVTLAPTYEVFWGIFVANVDDLPWQFELKYELQYDVIFSARTNNLYVPQPKPSSLKSYFKREATPSRVNTKYVLDV